jgi:CRISPR-associated protein Csb1
VFGAWDSTGPKGGLGTKFERAMVSETVGFGASISEHHKNLGIRKDPLEASRSVPLLRNEDKTWKVSHDPKQKGVIRPSEVNHGSVPFSNDNAGVTIDYAEQITTLSLICLRRLRFPVAKPAPDQTAANAAAQTVLAALGLSAAALAFETGMGLRSRCLLWPEGPMTWELLAKPGEKPQEFILTGTEAVDLLKAAVTAAKSAGVVWREAPLPLTPSAELVKLVQLSQEQAKKSGGETEGD